MQSTKYQFQRDMGLLTMELKPYEYKPGKYWHVMFQLSEKNGGSMKEDMFDQDNETPEAFSFYAALQHLMTL